MQILRKTKLEALEKARALGPDGVLNRLEEKRLVGRGGAAFPTAKKWRFARDAEADERYVICNADEGEPGTFKDKFILQYNPDTMIEGTLIAAETVGAGKAYIYLRGEYESLRPMLQERVNKVVEESGSRVEVEIVRGAGAYICGEETAIIQSIMGYRGHAMYKPPYPTVEGLWGRPTVTNNVETLTCAAQALLYDDWNPELRLFSISGNVSNPGVYELPLGVKMNTIIDIAQPAKKLKAVSLGCFGGIMPLDENVKITNEFILKHNCHHGAYTFILIDEDVNVVDVNLSIAKFYTYESCGKCTPCREGTVRLLALLKKVRDGTATEEDLETMEEFARHVQDTSLCGLGQTAGQHILTSLEHFRDDFEAYMDEGKQ
ncbi:NADH-quinone oxidoreductase subunit F [Candidatus Woesearchaeota archaeon]|nr:NADH-quinone oxidoreductase subunit F [Candidatus Woesearchaeota archaeon]